MAQSPEEKTEFKANIYQKIHQEIEPYLDMWRKVHELQSYPDISGHVVRLSNVCAPIFEKET